MLVANGICAGRSGVSSVAHAAIGGEARPPDPVGEVHEPPVRQLLEHRHPGIEVLLVEGDVQRAGERPAHDARRRQRRAHEHELGQRTELLLDDRVGVVVVVVLHAVVGEVDLLLEVGSLGLLGGQYVALLRVLDARGAEVQPRGGLAMASSEGAWCHSFAPMTS